MSAATVGRRDTMELWPEWEQVLFANVTDEVAQDNLNECVHELLEKAATVGRSCAACPEMDNPDSYISHLQSALRWHDEHVPRPTNPRNTCVVLQGEKPPEEVLFVGPDGVTHYQPEDATAGAEPDDAAKRLRGLADSINWNVCDHGGLPYELRSIANEIDAGRTATRISVPRGNHTSIGHYECGECRGEVGAQDAYCKHCGARLVEP